MEKDYVSFETAKLLKEKGFDIPCDNYYDSSGKTPNESVYGGANIETLDYNAGPFVKFGFPKFKTFSAPTQSTAMKWLREVHNIDVCVCREIDEHGDCFDGYIAVVYSNKVYKVTIRDVEKDLSFEEAVEAAIKYCLENLI